MPPALPDLTLPRDGAQTLRRVLANDWSLLARQLLEGARAEASTPLGDRVAERVASVLGTHPSAVVALARRPSVASRLSHARAVQPMDSRAASRWRRAALHDVALEMAVAGWLGGELALSREGEQWPALRSPSLHAELCVDAGVARVALKPGAMVLDGRAVDLRGPLESVPGLHVREAWRDLDDRLALALWDENPVAHVGFHPERPANLVDLGGRSVESWCDALREALALVTAHLPVLTPERRLLAQVLVPVGAAAERHFSCTYENAPGATYLSLHPDPVKMAEALVHEFQHDKLHAALRLDPLLANGDDDGFRSPVRPDPRPLRGVLLAVHAFVAVATLYAAMRDAGHPASAHPRFAARVAEVDDANREAMAVLRAHGRWTPTGSQLWSELRALTGE